MSIIRTNEARLDLIDLAYYISLDNLDAANRFLDAAEETFEDLERMQLMGSVREYRNREFSGIRLWRVKGFRNYLIFYRPIEDGIEIVRVIHSSRDIEALFSEEDWER